MMIKNKTNTIVLFFILVFTVSTSYLIFRCYTNNFSNYYLINLIISALFLFIFILIFFLKKEYKKNILLIFTSTYFTLLCIEIIINIHTVYFKELNVHFRHSEYEKLLKYNENYVRPIFPHLHSKDFNNNSKSFYPLTGISLRPTFMCAESGYWVSYSSDRYGFNNNDYLWDQKEIDFLLIGDSFVHGYCVENKFNFSGRIQEYTKKKVINLGYGGTGPLIQLAQLKEYGFKIKPKKIIWIYGEGNDLDNLREELEIPIIKEYLKPNFSQGLIFKQKEIDQFLLKLLKKEYLLNSKNRENEKKKRWDFMLGNIFKLYMIRKNTINNFLNLDKNQKIIIDTKSELKRNNDVNGSEKNLKFFGIIAKEFKQLSILQDSELYFVYLPNYIRYSKDYSFAPENVMYNREKILKIITNLNIPIIDLHEEVFKLEKDPISLFPYRKNRHYNKDGFDKSSKAIVNNIN